MRRLGRYVICDSDEFERLTDIADKRLREVSCSNCGGDGWDANWGGAFTCRRCGGSGRVYAYGRYDTGTPLDDRRQPVKEPPQ